MSVARGATPSARMGIGLLLAAVTMFTVLDTIAKHLVQTYPPMMVVWARYALHVAWMALLLVPPMGRALVSTRRPGTQALRGVLLGAGSMFFFSGLAVIPLAEASSITQITPILVTLLAVRWLGERAPAGTWAALGACLVGVLAIVKPGSAVFSWGSLLPLGNALCFTFYQLLTRKLASVDDGLATLFLGGCGAAAVASLAVPFVWTLPRTPIDAAAFLATGAIGAFGHLLLVRAFQRAPASTLAPFSYFQVLVALAAGWLAFGQFPDAIALAGMALIAASGLALALRHRVRIARTG